MGLLKKNDRIFIAGHNGLVGSAILKKLMTIGYNNLILKSRSELNLLNESDVKRFFKDEKIDVVFLAAAKVGGIGANNSFSADFIFENMQIQNNVIWNSHLSGIHRLIFLGSSCIYPKHATQPIKESALMTGHLEPTNYAYAIAKISGLKLIQSLRDQYERDYFSIMPTNLFGNNDTYDLNNSHVIPALIIKFHTACKQNLNEVTIWGDGTPLREFMHNDELAEHICFLAENMTFDDLKNSILGKEGLSHINIGSGFEISIKNLAETIASFFKFKGVILFDSSKPNGTIRKLMDSSFYYIFSGKEKMNNNIFKETLFETINNYCNSNKMPLY